ncbi:MAG TPA: hypothetical protein VIH61_01240 [Waddliaceae bacterium]
MKKKILIAGLLLAIGFGSAWANEPTFAYVHPAPVMRNIPSGELPTALRDEIKDEYKDYWITDLYETVGKKKPSYFITLQNADQIITLSATDSENWVVTGTTIKNS